MQETVREHCIDSSTVVLLFSWKQMQRMVAGPETASDSMVECTRLIIVDSVVLRPDPA